MTRGTTAVHGLRDEPPAKTLMTRNSFTDATKLGETLSKECRRGTWTGKPDGSSNLMPPDLHKVLNCPTVAVAGKIFV